MTRLHFQGQVILRKAASKEETGGLQRLGSERFQEQGWQEPYESRDSRTVLGGTGGETPPVYPTSRNI